MNKPPKAERTPEQGAGRSKLAAVILCVYWPAIFVANHQSSLDIPVLGRLLERDFTVVAKKEARWDPRAVVGSVVIDPAYIDRSDSDIIYAADHTATDCYFSGCLAEPCDEPDPGRGLAAPGRTIQL